MECLGYRRRSHRWSTTIPTMELAYANGTESVTAYVFLEDHERVLDWSDQSYLAVSEPSWIPLPRLGPSPRVLRSPRTSGSSSESEGTTRTLIARPIASIP